MSEKLFTVSIEPTELIRIPILPAQIVTYESGLEQRNRVWNHARFRFDLRWLFPLADVQVNSVANFFLEHGGDFEAFLFQPELYSAGLGSLAVLGKGTGARTSFKTHGNRFGSAQILVDGSSVTATYSAGNALITLAAAPSSGAIVTTVVQSERFVVRFAESQVNHEFFLWKLTRGSQVSLIQDKGLV